MPDLAPARRRLMCAFLAGWLLSACWAIPTPTQRVVPSLTRSPSTSTSSAPSATSLQAAPNASQAANIGVLQGTTVALDLLQITAPAEHAATGELHWPLAIPGVLKQTYSSTHQGIDIAAPPGTPVLAADNGVVVFADDADVYGNLLIVDHGNGYQTWYGHLDAFAVAAAVSVEQGAVIGYLGNTGLSSGPHLHLEVRYQGRPVPPFSHLTNTPQSILEAGVADERRTATAIAAATQTRIAFIAGQTATAAYLAELTRAAAELTRLAQSRTPTRPVPATLTQTRTGTASATSGPTNTITSTATVPAATPTATAAPSQTAAPTLAPTPSATAPPLPSATPTGTKVEDEPSATPTGASATPPD